MQGCDYEIRLIFRAFFVIDNLRILQEDSASRGDQMLAIPHDRSFTLKFWRACYHASRRSSSSHFPLHAVWRSLLGSQPYIGPFSRPVAANKYTAELAACFIRL